ncbi:hypothetical protein BOX15_Mlig015667g1 [Macrostomum lignano]|uniref:Uncharacterized protein n=1 Tax=Macrostomum lignano TaxID=282301 RepID=A0A267DJM3_9PLAT|nr:hypothetical protein BOX15_Mlig015667g1 [Macrostomum lignano]
MQLVALGLNSNKKVELVPISSDEAAGLHRLLVVEFNPVMQGTNCDERVPCPENQQDGSARIVMIVVGAIVLLLVAVTVFYFVRKCRRPAKSTTENNNDGVNIPLNAMPTRLSLP